MNKKLNYAFLAFLAWMAALLTVMVLSTGCQSGASMTYQTLEDGRVHKNQNTSCAAYY